MLLDDHLNFNYNSFLFSAGPASTVLTVMTTDSAGNRTCKLRYQHKMGFALPICHPVLLNFGECFEICFKKLMFMQTYFE